MNKNITINWWDDENRNSYYLILDEYNLKLINEFESLEDEDETEIILRGSNEDIKRFLDDFDSYTLEPFDRLNRKYDDEDEYYTEIKNLCEKYLTNVIKHV